MHITINDIKGEKTIDLSYPIHSGKKIAVISMLSDNVQYKIIKPLTIVDKISPGKQTLVSSKAYAGRELLSVLEGMIELTKFADDDRVI